MAYKASRDEQWIQDQAVLLQLWHDRDGAPTSTARSQPDARGDENLDMPKAGLKLWWEGLQSQEGLSPFTCHYRPYHQRLSSEKSTLWGVTTHPASLRIPTVRGKQYISYCNHKEIRIFHASDHDKLLSPVIRHNSPSILKQCRWWGSWAHS